VYERRFRETLANDVHMPGVVALVNELDHASDVSPGEKYRLLADWDAVLGLALEREAASGWEPTDQMRAKMHARDAARDQKDYATSDRIRDELAAMGLEVMDGPEGTTVRRR
jgi:cysteinyl-tRNA synthetase